MKETQSRREKDKVTQDEDEEVTAKLHSGLSGYMESSS